MTVKTFIALFLCLTNTIANHAIANCNIKVDTWPRQSSVLDFIDDIGRCTPDTLRFTDIPYALDDTPYTSNTLRLDGFTGPLAVGVSGGLSSVLIKNGTDHGETATVDPGDTLAVRTITGDGPITQVTISLGLSRSSWTLTHADIAPVTPPDGDLFGFTPTNFGVSEGAANLNIPIALSPGTGVTPELALTYNSQGGNGLLGVGFSLTGLSVIGRTGTTLSEDGYLDGVDFDAHDRFVLDGQRLVTPDSSRYGKDGTQYRTRHNTFQSIHSRGVAGVGPEWFRVRTRAGLIMDYGATEDSRIEAEGRSDALFWAVNKIQDTAGNYMTISYEEDEAGSSFRPSRIDYSGNVGMGMAPYNSVRFTYEPRPDVTTGTLGGATVTRTHRMTNIATYSGEDLVREYRLSYGTGTATGFSRLAKVTECSGEGQCFNPTFFGWRNGVANLEDAGQWIDTDYNSFAGSSELVRNMDVTGDGLADIVLGPDPSGDWHVLRNTGSSFVDEGAWIQGVYVGWRSDPLTTFALDANGDGMSDILMGPDSQGRWFLLRSTGTSFVDEGQVLSSGYGGWHNSGSRIRPMDVNGDNLVDILLGPDSNGEWFFIRNDGDAFKDRGSVISGFGNAWTGAPHRIRSMDVNGDGRGDMVLGPNDLGEWFVMQSIGNRFVDAGIWATGAYGNWRNQTNRIHTVDLEGDGLPDMLVGPDTSGRWFVMRNSDGRFVDEGQILTGKYGNFAGSPQRIRPQDVNGDGKTDMMIGPANGAWYVMQGTGDSFIDQGEKISGAFSGWDSAHTRIRQVDADGDGLVDRVIGPSSDGKWFVLRSTAGAGKDLLTSFKNGANLTTRITYETLAASSSVCRADDVSWPNQSFHAPLDVVTAYESDNGVGETYRFTYRYNGPVINTQGQGFLGFRQVDMREEHSGIRTVTTYRTEDAYRGMVEKTMQYAADGSLVTTVENMLGHQVGTYGEIFAYQEAGITTTYELNGILTTRTATAYTYDANGNVTQIDVVYKEGHSETVVNTYDDNISRWHLGRLVRSEVTKQAPGRPDITKTSSFVYEGDTGFLVEEVIEPGHPTLELVKTYQHDGFGNITHSTISGPGIAPRTTETVYDNQGRFVLQTTNALGHQEQKDHDPLLGNLVRLIDPNGLITTWQYDSFGRVVRVQRPDGVETIKSYRWCVSECPSDGVYFVDTRTPGFPIERVIYTGLNQERRRSVQSFDGRWVHRDTFHNRRGEAASGTTPFFTQADRQFSGATFDEMGRKTKVTEPGSRVTNIVHNGFETSTTNTLGQQLRQVVNSLGQLLESEDDSGHQLFFRYDSTEKLLEIEDMDGNITAFQHDIRGNKIWMNDPDTGQTSYEYDTLGQVTKQTDARGIAIRMEYDALGRITKKIMPEGNVIWTYDTQPNGIGKPASVRRGNQYREDYTYDSFGRPRETKTTIGDDIYFMSTTVDQYGRADSLTYPSGFVVRYVYNEAGHLAEVIDGRTDALFWKADRVNAFGQYEQFTLGNELVTRRSYDPETQVVESIQTGYLSGTEIQDLVFTYDALGNLRERIDHNQFGINETFEYDNLNRLTNATVTGRSSIDVAYDGLGNITYKSDVGSYTYGENGAGPHAVTSIEGDVNQLFTYDDVGNRRSGNGLTLNYTSFNKPSLIRKGDHTLTFAYNHADQRYQQTIASPEETRVLTYVGQGLFEREVTGTRVQEHHYIRAANSIVAVHTTDTQDNMGDQTRYLHKDHLGSLNVVTDSNGVVVERLSFDPWGNRRTVEWETPVNPITSVINMGFTGHEQLDEVGLVHMNGRVYDPMLGRFLSADPFVQAPQFLQSMNRYSYVMNNPLSFTDPSGFFLSKLWKGIKKAVKKVVNFVKDNWTTIAAVGVGLLTGGIGASLGAWLGGAAGLAGSQLALATAVGYGFGTGFGSTFAGTLLAGGSIGDAFKNGLRSGGKKAITAALTFGFDSVSSLADNFAGNVITGAVRNSIDSLVNNGRLGHTVLSDAFIAGLGSSVNQGFSSRFGREVVNLVVGGTTSLINGGKFLNGAATVAFQRLFSAMPVKPVLNVIGKIWGLPNTLIGLAVGGLSRALGGDSVGFEYNAISFRSSPLMSAGGGLTLGNAIFFGSEAFKRDPLVGFHEQVHTRQSEIFGPAYLPLHAIGMSLSVISYPIKSLRRENRSIAHGRLNFMEGNLFSSHLYGPY